MQRNRKAERQRVIVGARERRREKRRERGRRENKKKRILPFKGRGSACSQRPLSRPGYYLNTGHGRRGDVLCQAPRGWSGVS